MRTGNPFHEGELQAQERASTRDEGARNGESIDDEIMTGALKFIAQQSMVVLGSVDDDQAVWASVLFGQPGFVTAPNERTVAFDLSCAGVDDLDPLWANIRHDRRVGTLFMESVTRRRLRVNGTVTRPEPDRLLLAVSECYPNCPKYIQRRRLQADATQYTGEVSPAIEGRSLGREQAELIQATDTLFVASAHPEGGVDASHRGGMPGFVDVVDERTLRIPDYAGNGMFNTFGNLVVNPHAGLLLIEFEGDRMLQLIGRAEILWRREDSVGRTGGTQRFWNFKIDRWRESIVPVTLRWAFVDYSTHNPRAGMDS